jgi:hypothetical protein
VHVEVHARWSMLAVVSNNELPSVPVSMAQPSLQIRHRVTRLLQGIVEQGRDDGTFDVPDVALVVAAWFDGEHDATGSTHQADSHERHRATKAPAALVMSLRIDDGFSV